jgi:hypothetical protein
LAVNTPGQSGNPNSPHYRDLSELWANQEYFPLLYSRGAVERNTESRIILVPARPLNGNWGPPLGGPQFPLPKHRITVRPIEELKSSEVSRKPVP